MIEFTAGVLQTSPDVFQLKVRMFSEDLFCAQPGGQQIEYIRYPDAHTTNARATAALVWVNGNTTCNFSHGGKLGESWVQ